MHGLNRTWTSTKQTRPLRRRSGRCGSPATGLVLAPFCNRGWRFQMQLSTVADLASAVADEHGSSSEPVELPTARARSCSDLLLHGGEHVQHLQCLRVYTCAPTWLAACFVDTPRCHWNRIRSTGHCVRERNERKGKRTVERALPRLVPRLCDGNPGCAGDSGAGTCRWTTCTDQGLRPSCVTHPCMVAYAQKVSKPRSLGWLDCSFSHLSFAYRTKRTFQ